MKKHYEKRVIIVDNQRSVQVHGQMWDNGVEERHPHQKLTVMHPLPIRPRGFFFLRGINSSRRFFF